MPDRQENSRTTEYAADPGTAGSPERARQAETGGLKRRTITLISVILAVIAAAALFSSDMAVRTGYQRMKEASDRYIEAQRAASDMESGSDYLTECVRCFVVTGDEEYLRDFQEEVEVTRRRDGAVSRLEMLLQEGGDALESLNTALRLSNELVETEYHAMQLKLQTGDYDEAQIPDAIQAYELTEEELALSSEEKNRLAQTLVFDNHYMNHKDQIRDNVSRCTEALIEASSRELESASAKMSRLVSLQTGLTILFLLIVILSAALINQMVRRPLAQMVERMKRQETIPPTGAAELRFVTLIYNEILAENRKARERLRHEASHDALTGLLNRGAYDMLMKTMDPSHLALVLVDVDFFKTVNDTYGHDVGDLVLKRVAEILRKSFRSSDLICRIGGDEFVVIMNRMNQSMSPLVKSKVEVMNGILKNPEDGLPPVSLSVGVAFSDRKNPGGDLFKDADTALYQVKDKDRGGCCVYGEEDM